MKLVSKDGNYLYFVNDDLKRDKDVVIAAICSDLNALSYVDDDIKNDPAVRIVVLKLLKNAIIKKYDKTDSKGLQRYRR